LLSKTRPNVPILAFTPETATYRRLNILWGVHPYLVPHVATIEEMVQVVEKELIASTPFQPGQQVVLICGFPVTDIRPTNLALLHTIGEK
jgi:pyruvate kinase